MKLQRLLPGLGLTGSIAALFAQPAWAQLVQVTGVRVETTSAGLAVVLETNNATTPQVSTSSYDQTLLIDVNNATLNLPSGEEFRSDNPAPGITSITVAPLYTNSIRVTVKGAAQVPTAEVQTTPQGFIVSVPTDTSAAQAPPQTTPESPAETPDATPPSAETPNATPPSAETPDAAQPSAETPNAAQPPAEAPEQDEIEVVVTATRTAENPLNVPRSVTVINREQIEEQATLTPDLGDILGRLTPGFGPSSERAFTAASLRGRNAAILIDGVPQNTNSRGFERELRTIDPASVERIEVVRGASAIYGQGATGGIINIITRKPTEQQLSSTTEVGITAALGELEGDSFGNSFQHTISANQGNFDITLGATIARSGAAYDAEGDRIPTVQGTDDSRTLNFLGKFGVDFNDQQRLQLSVNHYDNKRDTNVISDPIVDLLPGAQKSRAIEFSQELDYRGASLPGDLNTVVNLTYTHKNLFGSQVQAQAYYRNNETRANARDQRDSEQGILQAFLESENWGGRLQIETPISTSARVLWGADYANEESFFGRNLFNPAEYDRTRGRVYEKVGEITLIPEYKLNSLGLFAQLQWDVSNRFAVSGGVRYENIDFSVDEFTPLFDSDFNFYSGQPIEGGELDFNATTFNVGAVYKVTPAISVFANFAQGFSVPDFGNILLAPPRGFDIENGVRDLEPQKVNNYELGIRGNWSNVQASISGFYNTSDLGLTFVFDPNENIFDFVRAPERIYGVEATLDWQLAKRWQLGGTLSWSEGEADLNDDDDYTPLSGLRIQPLKLTAYLENETTPGWRNRLQALFVGSRDRAFEEDIDAAEVKSYVTLDFISSIKVGSSGTLSIAIENLLDNQYFPAYAQLNREAFDSFYSPASGRTVSVRYSITW